MKLLKYVVLGLLLVSLLAGPGCDLLPPFIFEFPSPPGVSPTPGGTTVPTPPQPTQTTGAAAPIDPNWSPSISSGQNPVLPSYADVVVAAAPSVVSIQTEGLSYDIFLQPVPEKGAGSGVIIDGRGYVVTNNHVVEGASSIKVSLSDGRVFDAIKVNRDVQTDLAVIQIQGNDLPVAKLGRADRLRIGDHVVAIGNALALEGGATVTAGIVSYLGRSIQEPNGVTLYNLIQTDAAINPGNSGGALLNMAGELVGINTAIAGEAQNIGFALSITPAMPTIESLIRVGKAVRAYLGVTFQTVTPTLVSRYNLTVSKGVLLTLVQNGTPASRAGLRVQDIVTVFGGQHVTTAEQLRQAIQSKRPGDTVEVVYYRGAQQSTTSVTLGENPNP
jgi:serine protease Do